MEVLLATMVADVLNETLRSRIDAALFWNKAPHRKLSAGFIEAEGADEHA